MTYLDEALITTYPVASLLLDQSNPRLRHTVESQRDAVNAHLEKRADQLLNLARDIAEHGEINPTELPIIVEEAGDLIVIEGNRRLAALKLLSNPSLAHDAGYKAEFQKIAKSGIVPTEVTCAKLASREDAAHWLQLRHTGANEGRGVVRWGTYEQFKFKELVLKSRPGHNDRAVAFLTAVEKEFDDQPQLLTHLEIVRTQRLTTLGRLVSDPEVRRAFGFDFEGDKVVFHYRRDEMLPGIVRIFSDLAEKLGVSAIKNKTEREGYIKHSRAVLPDRATRLGQPWEPGTGESSASRGHTESSGRATKGHDKKKAPAEERVIFQGLELSHVDGRTLRLLTEAQSIKIDDAPGVAAVILRVLLELVVTEAGQRLRDPIGEDETLRKKIRGVILFLDPQRGSNRLTKDYKARDRTLDAPWLKSQDPDTGIAIESMNAWVHSIMVEPSAREVRQYSRAFRALLERLDKFLGGSATP